ncbi:MAG: PAS domain-containing protein [Methanospirillum sp.]|uniref:methyl-accepting chemotaxis protein n=1 Tax=Methanospirillum sp. TaxID=45200 RepID=UPI0023691F13|nr:PAS domain-containing protein [Methanospirillum sp.]MDD1728500.1 PAS domain-containing protein [Methanospirillum sp.]
MTGKAPAIITSKDPSSLQTIIDSIPVATLIISPEGQFIDCNKPTLQIFDATSREDIIGKPPGLLSPVKQLNGTDSDAESRRFIQIANETGSATFYFDHKTLKGRIFQAKVALTEILYEDKPCLMTTITDMTGQVRIEEIETLINQNPHGIYTLNPDLTIADVNPAFLKMSGYNREDWIGRNLTDFKVIKREGPSVSDAVKTRTTQTGKLTVEFPTGIRDLEYSYIPVFDAEGKLILIYDVFADQTELSEKITESNSLVAENPASIITMEPSGKILSTNPAFQVLSKISAEKLLTMQLQEFNILERDGLPLKDILNSKQTARGRLVVDFGWAIKTLDFTYIPVVNASGIVTSLVAMYVDVSDQVAYVDEIKTFIRENPHAILTMTPDLHITDVNPAFVRITGYTPDECTRLKLSDFNVIKREGKTTKDAISTKKPAGGVIVVEFPAGIRHLDYLYIPITDKKGDVIRILEIFSDMTNLVEKITESNSLVSENPASIITMESSGKILSTNPAFQALSKISAEKLLSMRVQDFNILERDGLPLKDILTSKQAAKGRLVVDFGWAVKILDFTYIPVLNASGIVTSLVAMYVDVTDQVAYIEEIQAFIRENPHAILMMDPDMSITDVNPAFSHIMGYSHEEIIRMKLSDIKVLEREGKSFRDALETKKPAKGRLVVSTPAGIRHADVVYIPIMDKKGTVIRFIEIFSDMTAVRSMVQYLEQSVEGVQDNISALAKGDTNFTVKILDADEHSASAREQFVKIGDAVDTARQAITQLVEDSNDIATAAIAGNMKFRSDASVHEGDYRKIIEGMNSTLDSIKIPVREAMNIAHEYAKYNFVVRFDPTLDIKGDWVPFKEALNGIGIQVSDAIALINKNVHDLAASAEEATASVEEVLAGAQQIAINTGKVSQNSEQGGDGISQVLRAMEDLNVTVGAVSQKAESVSVASDEANTLAKGGIDLARESEKAMGEITVSANEVGIIVTGINAQMDEIGKIVRLISDIANQTNLLALNAAIEAARAGEAGRGFAVVAAEVKSLAQDSRKSAEDIADMIAALQTKAKQATEAMGKSTSAVQEGSSALEQTLTAFSQIAETIEHINRNTVEVASASEEQAASVEEVTASIQEVSILVQNTSHEAGDAAAATQEASASIDEIGRIMTGVVGIVENITGEMAKFKVV